MTEEKFGTSSFSTVITFCLPESAGGDGSSWKGGRGGGTSRVTTSARAVGVQLHAGCSEPLLADRGDDGDAQVMLKRTWKKAQE